MQQFSTADLFKQVFGATLILPPIAGKALDAAGYNQYKVGGTPDPKELEAGKTWMGTPWLLPLVIKGGEYRRFSPKGSEIETFPFGGFVFPPATLVDFSQSKGITQTELKGGLGSVVEMYGVHNWEVRIRGLALDEWDTLNGTKSKTAQDYKTDLLELNRIIEPVGVIGSEFNERDITHIIIKSIRFQRLEGRPNVCPFEIDAISHTAFELEYA